MGKYSSASSGVFALEKALGDLAGTGAALDGGNVYYVLLSSKAFAPSFIADHQKFYSDGSAQLYLDPGTGAGIRNAIAACKGGRGDYIVVGTGAYTLTTAITLAGKSSVHLIGVNGLTCEIGSSGAAALTQTGDFPCIIAEAYCEIAGFQLVNHPAYPAITVPANIWRVNIHNNTIWGGGAGACHYIDASAAAAATHGYICNNRFSITGNSTSAIFVGTGTGTVISKNLISFHNGTLDMGIHTDGAMNIVSDNYISNSGAGGTITVGIDIAQYSCAIGNRIAVGATGSALSNGTTANSFVDNMDSSTGNTGGQITNMES